MRFGAGTLTAIMAHTLVENSFVAFPLVVQANQSPSSKSSIDIEIIIIQLYDSWNVNILLRTLLATRKLDVNSHQDVIYLKTSLHKNVNSPNR